MIEELRQHATPSYDDEPIPPPKPPSTRFLGMTPFQTFITSLLLLIITCLLSATCLLVTERIVLPF